MAAAQPSQPVARIRRIAASGFAAAAAFLSAASADDEWSAQVTPYAWLVAVDGAAVPHGASQPIDLEIGAFELLDGVRLGAMAAAEIRRKRWALIADGAYGKFLIDAASANATLAGEQLDIAVVLGDALLAYRVMETADVALDIVAGARLFAPRVNSVIQSGGGALSFDITDRFYVDPIVGMRSDISLTRRSRIRLYADIGGAAVSSDRTWQTYGGLSVDLGKAISLNAGYRIVAWRFVDSPDDPLKKLKGSGPMLALGVRF